MARKVNDGRVRLNQESIWDEPGATAKTSSGCGGCILQIAVAIIVIVLIFLFLWSKR